MTAARSSGQAARSLGLYVPMLPAVLFLLTFFLLPCVLVIIQSFPPGDPFSIYAEIIDDGLYLLVFLRTLELAAVTTLICVLVGFPIAVACARLKGFALSAALLMIFVPYTLSALIRAYGWIIILSDRGILNTTLINLGLIGQPMKLVFNTVGVYTGMVHVMLPVFILPVFAAVRAVDRNLLAASQALGCGPVRTFLYVFLPMVMPGIKCGAFLVFIVSLGFYITPALLGGPRFVMLVNLIDREARSFGNWETASAAATMLLAVVLLLFYLMNRYVGMLSFFGGQASAVGSRRAQVSRWRVRLSLAVMSGIGRIVAAAAARVDGGQRAALDRAAGIAGRTISTTFLVAVLAFLGLPIIIVVIMSLNAGGFMRFPPDGLSLRWFQAFFANAQWMSALSTSLRLAVMTTVAGLGMGALAAYAFARTSGRLPTLAMFLVISPMVMPPIIVAIGLYGLYVPAGLRATELGIVIAHLVGALPFIVTIMTAGFARFDDNLRRASLILGAGPWRTFRRIVLPLMLPSFVAAAAFCFIHSFDELVISQIIAGVRLQTLPMRIFGNLQNEIDPTVAAVGVVVIGITLLALALIELAKRLARSPAARGTTAHSLAGTT
jgi:putative spermidine/putrescine transport system permease protein